MSDVDPLLPFKVDPMNGREARSDEQAGMKESTVVKGYETRAKAGSEANETRAKARVKSDEARMKAPSEAGVKSAAEAKATP